MRDMNDFLIKRIEESEKCFLEELKQKDIIIANLANKLDQISEVNETSSSSQTGNTSKIQKTVPADVSPTIEKKHNDLLLIGDSIIKHIREDAINPGKETVISCHPGAKPNRIANEFKKIVECNTFDTIIVHCGINCVPQYSPAYTSDKIVELMEMVRSLAPTSKIAFSGLLPKIGPSYLPGINDINDRVFRASMNKHCKFAFVQHRDYIINTKGTIDTSVFCKTDGIHLSRKGVGALEKSLHNFIQM
ncbi:MAG: hypothetical protein HRT69_18620 [Flavobacteriaceae bacterium]|nr:hypothetical protein [Flavobacteriaceae bacterium]